MKTGDFFHNERQKRILIIDRLLREPGGRTREQICTDLKRRGYAASRHTFIRDIDHMRLDLKAPIGYEDRPVDHAPRGHTTFWFYRDRTWTLKEFPVTEEVLFSLLVAEQVVERYAGHPLAEELKTAYSKLGDVLNRKVSLAADKLAPVSFFPDSCQPLQAGAWKPVLKSIAERKMISIRYKPGWQNKGDLEETRTIHPYHIVNLSGTWYLLGSRNENEMAFRQYAIARISAAKVLAKDAIIPADFDIEEILDVTFGRFLGDPKNVVDVKVRLKQSVAPLVKSRVFSRRQTLNTLNNGDIELSFPVSRSGPWPLHHVKSWVLSWGPDCEVIEPPELRDLVRLAVEKISQKIER